MRLGINIPNELHRRLEPLKQYINVSQICRDAIEDRIACYEKALANWSDQDIVSAMERVWKEEMEMRDIVDVDWERLGLKDAKQWVTAARLRDWNYLHHRQAIIEKQGRPRWDLPTPPLEGADAFDDRWFELQGRILRQDEHFLDWLHERGGLDGETAQREYMSVWLAYTDSAWDLIREKRKLHMEERQRQRLEAQERRQDPTVPDELFRELDGDKRDSG